MKRLEERSRRLENVNNVRGYVVTAGSSCSLLAVEARGNRSNCQLNITSETNWQQLCGYIIVIIKSYCTNGADLITVSADGEICLYDNFTLDSLLQLQFTKNAHTEHYVICSAMRQTTIAIATNEVVEPSVVTVVSNVRCALLIGRHLANKLLVCHTSRQSVERAGCS